MVECWREGLARMPTVKGTRRRLDPLPHARFSLSLALKAHSTLTQTHIIYGETVRQEDPHVTKQWVNYVGTPFLSEPCMTDSSGKVKRKEKKRGKGAYCDGIKGKP